MGFKTATLQNTICTRIRRSNLVTEQLSPSNGSKARPNVYMSFLKCGVLQSGVAGGATLIAIQKERRDGTTLKSITSEFPTAGVPH